MQQTAKRPRIFYGWWITLASLGITFIAGGTGFYSFGILLKPLIAEFGWSRGSASVAQSIYIIVAAASGLLVGKMLERYGAKMTVIIGATITGISWFLLSRTTTTWYLYSMYFFVGFGLGIGGLVAVGVLIANWFTRRRGTALGIAMAGLALGAAILVPLVGFITEKYGWRIAYIFMGIAVFAIDIPLALILKTKPEEMGLLPDGETRSELNTAAIKAVSSAPPKPTSPPKRGGMPPWLTSLPLWLLCLSFTLAQIGEIAIITHEASFFVDMGIAATAAASALGFTGAMGGVGRLVFGWLVDRMSTRYVVLLSFAMQLAGVLILMQTQTMATVWLFVFVFGFSMGGLVALMPLAIVDLFGRTSFGTIYGFVHFVVISLSAAGPSLAGFIFDATGSYSLVFVIFAVTYAVSLVVVYFTWGADPRPLRNLRIYGR
ncbi:MAG: MFS transporter [Chloroflexota bacterium]